MLLIFRKDGHRILFFSKDTPVFRYVYAALIPVAVGLIVLLICSWVPMAKSEPQAIYDSLWLIVLWMSIHVSFFVEGPVFIFFLTLSHPYPWLSGY